MGLAIDYQLLGLATILLLSVLASMVSDRLGVPALVLFLALGMLAGLDGPGGIYYDDAALSELLGAAAVALFSFSGGLDTNWKQVRPVLRRLFSPCCARRTSASKASSNPCWNWSRAATIQWQPS